MSSTDTHGSMKRRIARLADLDQERWRDDVGVERHKEFTKQELQVIARELGLEMIVDEPKQTIRDTIMLRLDRDHRTGIGMFDSSDLQALIAALEGGGDGE